MDENRTNDALAQAREQIRHTIERLDEIRSDLEATAAGLRLPERGEDIDEPLAGLCEVDAVIRCGLHDHLKPLISGLRLVLPGDVGGVMRGCPDRDCDAERDVRRAGEDPSRHHG